MNSKELREKFENGELSYDVYRSLLQSNRKIRYYTYDLKAERVVIDGDKVIILPAREDSYERLVELGHEFGADESMEELVAESLLQEQLHIALSRLTEKERWLVKEIFYFNRSQREVAETLGISQPAVKKRHDKLIKKIRKLMKL